MNNLLKIIIFLFITLSLVFCKKENIKKRNHLTEDVKVESFDDFKKQFFSDSIFQKSRIKFPVKNIINDVDYGQEIKEIKNSDWFFLNIYKPNYIVSFENKEKIISMILQIDDTGVYVIYRFKKIKGKWHLVEIEDQST